MGSKAEGISKLNEQNSRSKILPKMMLSTLAGDSQEFKTSIIQAYQKAANKVYPSFFKEMRPLYSDKSKAEVIGSILLENLASLEKDLTFEGDDQVQFPTVLMYTFYLLGWHYVFTGDFEKALTFSKKCEEHTPTFLENVVL